MLGAFNHFPIKYENIIVRTVYIKLPKITMIEAEVLNLSKSFRAFFKSPPFNMTDNTPPIIYVPKSTTTNNANGFVKIVKKNNFTLPFFSFKNAPIYYFSRNSLTDNSSVASAALLNSWSILFHKKKHTILYILIYVYVLK